MAEIKNGKITFNADEQPLVDQFVKDRIKRETEKFEETIRQLTEDKDIANKSLTEMSQNYKSMENTLKKLGVEKANLKDFVKNYEEIKKYADEWRTAQVNADRKQAFIEAGGKADKFEKALRLATFKDEKGEDIDTKVAFENLLKDDDFANLRETTNPDVNAGDKQGVDPTSDKTDLASVMETRLFGT